MSFFYQQAIKDLEYLYTHPCSFQIDLMYTEYIPKLVILRNEWYKVGENGVPHSECPFYGQTFPYTR